MREFANPLPPIRTPARTSARNAFVVALLGAITWTGGVSVARAAGEEERTRAIREIFEPFQTDRAALSPDGKHLAFEQRTGDRLFVVLVELETNKAVSLPLTGDLAAGLTGLSGKIPSRITYLKWVSSNRLLGGVQSSALFGVDADGKNFKTLIDSRDAREMVDPWEADFARSAPPWGRSRDLGSMPFGGTSEFGRAATPNPDGSFGFMTSKFASRGNLFTQPRSGGFANPRINLFTTLDAEVGESATMDVFDSSAEAGYVPDFAPHVLEILANEPDTVLVEIRRKLGPTDDLDFRASASLRSAVFKLDVRTGKTRALVEEAFTNRILCDKAGVPRAKLHILGNDRVWRLAPPGGGRFVPYEKVLKGVVPVLEFAPKTFLGERSIPLGFDYDPRVLYYASNVGRSTYAIRAVDVFTKSDLGVVMEHAALDFVPPSEVLGEDVLVFDRFQRRLVGARIDGLKAETHWLDPELLRLQGRLEQASPGMSVEILDWDEARTKFLLRVSSQTDPGAFYLYDVAKQRVFEYARRAPWIKKDATNYSRSFAFTTAEGVRLTGYLTLPRTPRVTPTPLLVYCHDGPWTRDMPGYDRGAQALATMGFAVLQVNYRGSGGFGREHLLALRDSGESGALADINAAIEWFQPREEVSKKRVAILGNGYGGYLALRAMQEFPERFRCAVSINAPTNLQRWIVDSGEAFSFNDELRQTVFGDDGARLRAASPALNGKPIKGPVLIVQAQNDPVVPERHARDLQRALAATDSVKPEVLDLPGEGHARWLPGTYVKVFDRMEQFFTANIFAFAVEMGPTEVVK